MMVEPTKLNPRRLRSLLNASESRDVVGIATAWIVALVGSIVLLKVTDLVVGVRASADQELEGLDLTEHGEEAYNLEM